jgi:heat shock protein HtpX
MARCATTREPRSTPPWRRGHGTSWRAARTIAVTEGLLEQLPADQVKGVLAHEFAHIKNHDILISSIAAMVAGAISAITSILQFSLLFGGSDEEDGPLGLIGTLAAIIVAPIAATLLQLGVSRQREYLADAAGAELLGRAAPLADALATLERGSQALPNERQPGDRFAVCREPLAASGDRDPVHDPPPDRGAHPAPARA